MVHAFNYTGLTETQYHSFSEATEMGSVMDKTIDASVWLLLFFFIICYVLRNCVVLLFTSLVQLKKSISRFLDLIELHRRD